MKVVVLSTKVPFVHGGQKNSSITCFGICGRQA